MQPLHHSSKGRPQLLSAGPSRVGLLVFATSAHCTPKTAHGTAALPDCRGLSLIAAWLSICL